MNEEAKAIDRPTVILNTARAAEYLCLSPKTLQALRYEGKGPAYIRLGVRAIRYRLEDLAAYAAANRVVGGAP